MISDFEYLYKYKNNNTPKYDYSIKINERGARLSCVNKVSDRSPLGLLLTHSFMEIVMLVRNSRFAGFGRSVLLHQGYNPLPYVAKVEPVCLK
jgi:hypothetical protein